jgi:DNA-binding LytR/AlgR family response regulator
MSAPAAPRTPLRALVVDDEEPARSELAFLLRRDERVGEVRTAAGAVEALQELAGRPVDVVFCDVKMPGPDGLDLVRELSRSAYRPQVVFVTAYDEHAVQAFDLHATDYVLKPVRSARLSEAVRRVLDSSVEGPARAAPDDETIAVELGGVTKFVPRSQVRYVEASGDYARLHTADGSHLVRVSLSALEERWPEREFVRIHRSTLVALRYIDELRSDSGHYSVRLGAVELPVSRRHSRELRHRLLPS